MPERRRNDFGAWSLTSKRDRNLRVGAIADGKIDDIPAKVGDSVKAGQILARIHSHDVHEARAGLPKPPWSSRVPARPRIRHSYERTRQRLFELKAGSRQDVDTAEAKCAMLRLRSTERKPSWKGAHAFGILLYRWRIPVTEERA